MRIARRMPLAVVLSRGLAGLDAPLVTVEIHLANGLPAFHLVGLPDTEVKESRERVRAALQNARFEFPARKITVNLAPADLPKESGRFDLPIAIGILAATGQVPGAALERHEFVGELALTGMLRPIRGALPIAIAAARDGHSLVLPAPSASEAVLARNARVLPAASLLAVCAYLAGREPLAIAERRAAEVATSVDTRAADAYPLLDLADVRGQIQAKRALTIAAAGDHSLLMIGPPGTGKSMLARRLPGLLPPPAEEEALAIAAIASLAGRFTPSAWGERPYRAPHHTASAVALTGGGSDPRPGEVSLAHHGVLFLDELPEWDRRVLEALREPLESGVIHVSRAARQSTFPAEFQLVAAMNPCPCGWLGHPSGRCRCSPERVARYRARVSGPLLDRIDLGIEVPSLPPEAMAVTREPSLASETSAAVRAQVADARARQAVRQGKPNARLGPRDLEAHCAPDAAGAALLAQAVARLSLSARAYHRILKVARTIADLGGAGAIGAAHVAEAVGYRRFERL